MKKTMLIVFAIAGMLFGSPLPDAQAGVGVNIRIGGKRHHHHHHRNWHRRYRHSGLSTSTAAMKQV